VIATIDIPDALYKRVKIRAVEAGRTLKEIVLISLERELSPAASEPAGAGTFGQRRRLRPEFQRLMESGSLGGGTDSTTIASDDRSSREDALF
jgi:hypothetical protein